MTSLLSHTTRRESALAVRSRVRALRARLARQLPAYEGGTAAERQAARRLAAETDAAERVERLRHTGRRIDLVALLRQRRADSLPAWTVADPRVEIGAANGGWRWPSAGSTAHVVWRGDYIAAGLGGPGPDIVPAGIVPLPPRVRALLTHPDVVAHATRVGVLWQPDAWLPDQRPDPALVVEWRDLPGEYYALAVWGQDRPGIMEFVD